MCVLQLAGVLGVSGDSECLFGSSNIVAATGKELASNSSLRRFLRNSVFGFECVFQLEMTKEGKNDALVPDLVIY
jgi:hypothetical protein